MYISKKQEERDASLKRGSLKTSKAEGHFSHRPSRLLPSRESLPSESPFLLGGRALESLVLRGRKERAENQLLPRCHRGPALLGWGAENWKPEGSESRLHQEAPGRPSAPEPAPPAAPRSSPCNTRQAGSARRSWQGISPQATQCPSGAPRESCQVGRGAHHAEGSNTIHGARLLVGSGTGWEMRLWGHTECPGTGAAPG